MGRVFEFKHVSIDIATPASRLDVGDSLWIDVNGISMEFLIVHQGNPDSSLYDSSCDGTWCLMKDVYGTRVWNSSQSGAYATSSIHTYLNGTFFDLLDSDIQAAIKQVKIPYINGAGSSSAATGSNGLSAKIFLLSIYELGWGENTETWFPNLHGSKLDYFLSGNSTEALQRRTAYYQNTATSWWSRSPRGGSTYYVIYSDTGGVYAYERAYNLSYGVRPCFILPSDFDITPYLTA